MFCRPGLEQVHCLFFLVSCLTTIQGGGAPAWFMPAMQVALQPLTDHVNEIARLSALVSCPFLIKFILPLIFLFSQACNRQMGNGAHLQFAIVLFPNGSDPTSAPVSHPCQFSQTLNWLNFQHNLPALISIERVDALTRAQSKRYFTGYYPDIEAANIPGTIANRRPFILRAIGCQQV